MAKKRKKKVEQKIKKPRSKNSTKDNQNNTINRLIQHLKKHGFKLTLAMLVSLCQVALTVYFPIVIGKSVDLMLGYKNVNFVQLRAHLVVLLLVSVGLALTRWFLPLVYNEVCYEIVSDLRDSIIKKLQRAPLSYLDKQSKGDIVSRLVADSNQLTDGLIMIFNQLFTGVLTLTVMIITMLGYDWLMSLIVILLTPLSLLTSRFIAKKSYEYFQAQASARGSQTEIIEESIQQNEILRLFNAHSIQTEKLNDANDLYTDYSVDAIFYSSTVNPTTRYINSIIYALVSGVGAMRIIRGDFTVGSLTTFLNYATEYTKPFNDISSVLAELQSALASAKRMFELEDIVQEQETGRIELYSDAVKGDIEFSNVSFRYDKNMPLIEDLNLRVKAGDQIAIVGPTGAGKSTLINLLMRFYDVDSGQILLDQVPTTRYTRSSLRKQFGMVLQDTWVKNDTIHNNVAYGKPGATRDEVIEACKKAHAHSFIQQLSDGYDTVIGAGGTSLSQGQQQLLSIARVFLTLPNLLILDEATSSIDTRTEILIQDAFSHLMEDKTSFVIAHRLSTIQSADLIIVMQNGRIVEQGTHQELLNKKGVYHQMQTARTIEI